MLPDLWDTSKFCNHFLFYFLFFLWPDFDFRSPNCFGVSQPTGCSGVPALPPGRPAQRGQQGHCEAERHCGGLRPPAVSNQTDTRACVPALTHTNTVLKSGLC